MLGVQNVPYKRCPRHLVRLARILSRPFPTNHEQYHERNQPRTEPTTNYTQHTDQEGAQADPPSWETVAKPTGDTGTIHIRNEKCPAPRAQTTKPVALATIP